VLLVVLLLIWAAALGPMVLRRLSERRLSSSVADFRNRTRRLEYAYPHLVAVTTATTEGGAQVATMMSEERRRAERVRNRRRRERRRRTLSTLGSTLAATLVLGAIPGLHVLWDLSILSFLLTAGYVGLLVYLAQGEAPIPDVRSTVVPIRQPVRERPAQPRLLVSSGESSGRPLGFIRRPAFVLVDGPVAASN